MSKRLIRKLLAQSFWVAILIAGVATVCASTESLKSTEIERVESADFIFYFPRGYESLPPLYEKETVIYFYGNKGGNSINVSRFDYLAGTELDEQLCTHLVQQFNRSELRTMVNASEAKGVKFAVEGGVRSCYYRYDFTTFTYRTTSYVEYKIYQGDTSQTYAVTVVYSEGSPEQAALQKALHSFLLKVTSTRGGESKRSQPEPK